MARMKGGRVLVTGGAGFIGSHICDALLEEGASVICFDDLSNSNGENISHLRKHARFEFFQGDIRNIEDCLAASHGCTHISHQAGMVSVPLSLSEPELCMQINVIGGSNVFKSAVENGVMRCVYASSAACYGDDAAELKLEDNIGKMLSPYAESKLKMEHMASELHKYGGTEFCGLRYFNVYGPRQDPFGAYASIIPALITKLQKGEGPTIFGDGEQTRDFIHVKDIARANILAMLAPSSDTGLICNVANGIPISINALFEMISIVLSEHISDFNRIQKLHVDAREGDIRHSLASVERAHRELDFRTSIDISEGLTDTIEWYIENIN